MKSDYKIGMKYRINFKKLFKPCSTTDKVIFANFFHFLLSNNAFNLYFENINNYTTCMIIDFSTGKNGMWLISSAFSWADSPQGFAFWDKLHQRWQASLYRSGVVKDLYSF